MGTGKILIVDDEVEALDNCRRMLSRLGHDCVTESDPIRAVQRIEYEHPDLVLTDLRMPGLDGMGVLAAAKRVDPAIKVVLLTAYATVQTAVESLRLGALDYILKPYTSRDLEEVTRRALGETAQKSPEGGSGMASHGADAAAIDLILPACSQRPHEKGGADRRQHFDLRGKRNGQRTGRSGHS
jgi:DNA-binding NtrC family response regulator